MPTDSAALAFSDLVTILVPARNEQATIVRCLDSIEAQGIPGLRVIVVDGVSEDGTVAAVEAFAEGSVLSISTLENPARTIPTALNIGTAAVTTPFVIRMDAHAEMQPGYVAAVVEALVTGEWGAVGGIKVPVGVSRFGRAAAVAFSTRLGSGGSYYHHGTERRPVEHVPFGAYPTYVVRALGGWDEALVVNQDYEFDHRLRRSGGRILFDPTIRALWWCRNSVRTLAYQYYRYGRGKAAVARKHPDSVRLRQFAPPLLPLAAAGGTLVGATLGSVTIAAAVPLIHLLLVVGIGSLEASRQEGASLSDVALTPLAIWIMHWTWGLGVLRGLPGGWKHVDPFHANPVVVDRQLSSSSSPSEGAAAQSGLATTTNTRP